MDKVGVYIVGSQNFQNELISYVLTKETELPCTIVGKIDSLTSDNQAEDLAKKLLLVDNAEHYFEQILRDIDNQKSVDSATYIIALFNLEQGMGIEHDALRRGVQGFFYKQDDLNLFIKGIKTLFTGEIWLSRDILVNLVLNSNITKMPSGQEKAGLTAREMEILALVSMGEKNYEIAEKLFISPHTVKTHLYNLFRKINVDNRFQAALWATQNL